MKLIKIKEDKWINVDYVTSVFKSQLPSDNGATAIWMLDNDAAICIPDKTVDEVAELINKAKEEAK